MLHSMDLTLHMHHVLGMGARARCIYRAIGLCRGVGWARPRVIDVAVGRHMPLFTVKGVGRLVNQTVGGAAGGGFLVFDPP
jgi:hypothetical protein